MCIISGGGVICASNTGASDGSPACRERRRGAIFAPRKVGRGAGYPVGIAGGRVVICASPDVARDGIPVRIERGRGISCASPTVLSGGVPVGLERARGIICASPPCGGRWTPSWPRKRARDTMRISRSWPRRWQTRGPRQRERGYLRAPRCGARWKPRGNRKMARGNLRIATVERDGIPVCREIGRGVICASHAVGEEMEFQWASKEGDGLSAHPPLY